MERSTINQWLGDTTSCRRPPFSDSEILFFLAMTLEPVCECDVPVDDGKIIDGQLMKLEVKC